jgi:hypothetical protein
MGYALLLSPCLRCGRVFACNPRKVPAIRIRGEKEPLCRDCYHHLARVRKAHGLPVLPLDPEAYEPIDEGEL